MKSKTTTGHKLIQCASPVFAGNEKKYLTDCIASGWVSSTGGYVERFETEFSRYCGCRYGIAVNSGTSALHLALQAVGVGPGDEVIIPALTYAASAFPVTSVGAKPVFIDSEEKTWNMDLDQLDSLITKNTKVVMPVHLYGLPVDMGRLNRLAKKYKLRVIEDAAEAHGARYHGKVTGGLGDVGCFSFYGNKTITTGEGGMLVTDDPKIARGARIYCNHGRVKHPREYYWHVVSGQNYAMTNLQAAVGLGQLEQIDHFLGKKRKIAFAYTRLLSDIPDLVTPAEPEGFTNSYWLYSVLLPVKTAAGRNRVIQKLADANIQTRPFFYPVPLLPVFKSSHRRKYPVSVSLARRGINLPSGVNLNSDEIEYISSTLKKVLKRI